MISGCRGRIAGWFKGKSEISRNPLLDYIILYIYIHHLIWESPNFLEGFPSSHSGNVDCWLSGNIFSKHALLCRQGWAMWCFWKNRCWSSPATTKATNGRSSSTASEPGKGATHRSNKQLPGRPFSLPWQPRVLLTTKTLGKHFTPSGFV